MIDRTLFDVLVYARLAVFLLAFLIALQAFRGYRRNDRPAMLRLAAAFVLLGLQPFVIVVLARVTGPVLSPRVVMAAEVLVLGTAFLLVHESLRLVGEGSA